MITFSESSKKNILDLLQAEAKEGLGLRLTIAGRGIDGFQYDLSFIKEEDKTDEDTVVDVGGFKVYIDPESAPNLKDSTVDFIEKDGESGFKIDNPNPLWADPLALSVQNVLDTKINPSVASHGGYVTLLEVKEDTAYIALGGGCQGCGMADVTLKQGIDVSIKESVPEIHQVIDSTDHASGNNPYYEPSKSGDSPSGDSPFA